MGRVEFLCLLRSEVCSSHPSVEAREPCSQHSAGISCVENPVKLDHPHFSKLHTDFIIIIGKLFLSLALWATESFTPGNYSLYDIVFIVYLLYLCE